MPKLKPLIYVVFLVISFCFNSCAFAQDSSLTINSALSHSLRDALESQQQTLYTNNLNINNADEPFNSDTVEYAMLEAQSGNKAAEKMARDILTRQLALLSKQPAMNTLNEADKNNKIESQAELMRIFSQAYALWRDPQYLLAAQQINENLRGFLNIPECLLLGANQIPSAQHQQKLSSELIDKHVFTRQMGILSNALAHLYMVTGDTKYLKQATNAVQWIIDNRNLSSGGFCHDVESAGNLYLDDNLAMGKSFLTLYQATANRNYLTLAQQTALFINKNFANTTNNDGFISMVSAQNNLTYAANIDRQENAQLARFANLLYYYTGQDIDKKIAVQAMNYLIKPSIVNQMPIATILLTDKELSQEPLNLTIVGGKKDPQAQALYLAALAFPSQYKHIEWWDKSEHPLLNNIVVYPALSKAAAFVCTQHRCSLPEFNPAEIPALIDAIEHFVPLWSEASFDVFGNPTGVSSTTILSTFNKNLPAVNDVGVSVAKPLIIISTQDRATMLLQNDNWFFIIPGFFIFGLLLAFTPCVLPMVPILVSIIAGQGKTLTTHKAFTLSLTYVLAMSLTYAGAGVLAGYAGSYVQAFLQNAWVLIIFSVIFVLLSLSLFGFYELRMPNGWHHKLTEYSNRQTGGTYVGVAIMGFFATLIVSPCVTAPLIGVLSYIGNTGNMVVGGIALFVMGLGMGLPLMVVGTGGGKLLPKSGHWLNTIKVFLGILLLGVAIWMLSRIISDELVVMLVSILMMGTSIYTGFLSVKYRGLGAKFWQVFSIVSLMYGLALSIGVLMGNASLFQPLKMKQVNMITNPVVAKVSFNYVKNISDLQAKLTIAKLHHKPVFLDFYADWCVSCKMMDRYVLTDPTVIQLLQNFVLLRADMTKNNADDIALAKHFNMIGPPVIIFFDAKGQQIKPAIVGEANSKDLIQRLKQIVYDKA